MFHRVTSERDTRDALTAPSPAADPDPPAESEPVPVPSDPPDAQHQTRLALARALEAAALAGKWDVVAQIAALLAEY